MKKIYHSIGTLLASSIAAVTAFFSSACDRIFPPSPTPVEYGTPSAIFQIKVSVTDADKKPIEGIDVKLILPENEDEGNGRNSTLEGLTDREGNVTLTNDFFFPRTATCSIVAKDIDGEKNGLWAEKKVSITVLEDNFHSVSSWSRFSEAHIEIILSPEELRYLSNK